MFALNLVVDYFCCYGKRFAAAPVFGDWGRERFSSLAVLLYLSPVVHCRFTGHPFTAAIMVLVTFRPLAWLEALFLWGGLFLVSFMLAGSVVALFSTGIVDTTVYPWALCALCASCLLLYLLFGVLRPYLEERKQQTLWHVELYINWQGKEKMIPAFTDTGNRLRSCSRAQSSLTTAAWRLLPDVMLRHLADTAADPWTPMQELKDYTLIVSTLVPYRG